MTKGVSYILNKRISIAAILILTAVFIVLIFSGCDNQNNKPDRLKIGMVYLSSAVADNPYNKNILLGIKKAANEISVESSCLRAEADAADSFLMQIDSLYRSGFRFIIAAPSDMNLSEAIYEAQIKYQDATFLTIDFSPSDGEENIIGKNTAAVYFSEQEPGFLSGLSAALEIKSGDFGIIYCSDSPSSRRFASGFVQGVEYANAKYKTTAAIAKKNILSLDQNASSEESVSAYDTLSQNGVCAIFCAVGNSNKNIIDACKNSWRDSNQGIWIVNAGFDAYSDGLIDNTHSVVLTSAVKKVDSVVYDMIKLAKKGAFPGGSSYTYTLADHAAGLPDENPNLREDVQKTQGFLFDEIVSGDIKIQSLSPLIAP